MGICQSTSDLEGGDGNGSSRVKGLRPPPDGERKFIASLYSKQGRKGPNQDSAILCQEYASEDGVFCGVFDGHGRNGHIVSKLVRDNLPSLLLSQRNKSLILQDHAGASKYDDDESSEDEDDEDNCYCSTAGSSPEMFDEWKEASVGAFKAMDKELKHLDLCYCSGSTGVTVIWQGKDLIIANLGDSRAILGTLNEEGDLEAIQLTTDLKPDLPHEAERIKKSNGRVFALQCEPNTHRVWLPYKDSPGLAMARAFGDFQLKSYGVIATPQVSYHHVQLHDQFVILATDGVWDMLSNDEVASIAWSIKKKEDAAKAIVLAAAHAWKCESRSSADDCTVVCLYLQEILGDEVTK